MIDAVIATAKIIAIIYLAIGFIMMVLAYMSQRDLDDNSIGTHILNLSFIILWLPYWFIYNRFEN